MNHMAQLLLVKFKWAWHLLYNELILEAQSLSQMHAWALKNKLNADAFDWFFSQHQKNIKLLKLLTRSLLTVIQDLKPLQNSFLNITADDIKVWCKKVIEQYETVIDKFLKRLLILIHMSFSQPLHESELFSVTWHNTHQWWNIYLKHRLIMLHTTYHKGQQQTGKFKNNIQFLSAPIEDLLLDYLMAVISLHQVFLCQFALHAVISLYLWWKDNKVWAENRLMQCMKQECTQAGTPQLHIVNWQQMTVNIIKIKFAADMRCFEVNLMTDDKNVKEIEADIQVMIKQRNHSMQTVNHVYVNQHNVNFSNVWDGLICRNLQASTLWKNL